MASEPVEKKGLWREFKEFAFKEDVLDLGVAFIFGIAFNAVVKSLVDDVLMQIVAAIGGGAKSFNAKFFMIHHQAIRYGAFLSALINFLIIAATLFVIVKVANTMRELRRHGDAGPPEQRDCPYCATEISAKASRCPHCTSELAPLAA